MSCPGVGAAWLVRRLEKIVFDPFSNTLRLGSTRHFVTGTSPVVGRMWAFSRDSRCPIVRCSKDVTPGSVEQRGACRSRPPGCSATCPCQAGQCLASASLSTPLPRFRPGFGHRCRPPVTAHDHPVWATLDTLESLRFCRSDPSAQAGEGPQPEPFCLAERDEPFREGRGFESPWLHPVKAADSHESADQRPSSFPPGRPGEGREHGRVTRNAGSAGPSGGWSP